MNPSLLDFRFVLLLTAFGVLRWLCPPRYYIPYAAVMSGVMVGFASPSTLLVIGAITVLFIYPLHRLMRTSVDRGWPKLVYTTLLVAGLGIIVSLFFSFKVCLSIDTLWFERSELMQSFLSVVGFSYFTCRAIDFLHIQAITKISERNPLALAYYALFPATLSSGPIQKYRDFRQQLSNPAPLTKSLVLASAYRITRGYFLKIVIASVLDGMVEKLLAVEHHNPLTSSLALCLLYLYFYCDFAGYSDIAIGFGLLAGIKVPENFRMPFLATTVSEFWRNWHITLVDWFRDHVYIPLGGMQGSRLHAGLLALFIMMLCGFWHGLSFSFMAWGLWHGSVLFVEAVCGSKPLPPTLRQGPWFWWRVFWVNARVAFGSIFFLPNTGSIFKVLNGFTGWIV